MRNYFNDVPGVKRFLFFAAAACFSDSVEPARFVPFEP